MLVPPPDGLWSRQAVADWVLAQQRSATLIGFDFSFAPPFVARGAYLPGEDTPADPRGFWAYVDRHCADIDLGASSFLEARRGAHFYLGAADGAKARFLHFRACEARYNALGGGKATTLYDAIGAAQVAKASFAGMRMLHQFDGKVAIWPFDAVPETGTVLVEIYTTIAARAAGVPKGRSKLRDGAALDSALIALGSAPHAPLPRYEDHATDAMLAAAWLRAHADDSALWRPATMTEQIRTHEGWTFGVR